MSDPQAEAGAAAEAMHVQIIEAAEDNSREGEK